MTISQHGEVQLSPARARELTDRIKIAMDATWSLITEAYTSRAWAALGYDSWDSYCAEEFGTTRLKLPREERQEVVGSLREAGLSLRAIASATGVGKSTVDRELQPAVPNGTPGNQSVTADHEESRPSVGTDGKVYPPRTPDLGVGEYWDAGDEPDTAPVEKKSSAQAPPRPRVDVARTVMRALSDIDTARRALAALTPTQLGRQDEEARRNWAANLHEQVEALTDFHANL